MTSFVKKAWVVAGTVLHETIPETVVYLSHLGTKCDWTCYPSRAYLFSTALDARDYVSEMSRLGIHNVKVIAVPFEFRLGDEAPLPTVSRSVVV